MEFVCCNIKYSTCDPKTFERIKRYKLSKFTKTIVKGHKISKEIVYELDCMRKNSLNPCRKIQIRRFAKINGKSFEIERKDLSGKRARKYLENNRKFMIELPQLTPFKTCPVQTKYIPMTYYEHFKTVIGVNEADIVKERYINGAGYTGKEIICPVLSAT